MQFEFEKMPVYTRAVNFSNDIETLCLSLRSNVTASFKDQLRRAALSVSLNIAEGYGRWHKADKQNFYRIARGSVFECVPLLKILNQRSLLPELDHQKHYETLQELARMLTGLIKSLEVK